MDVIPKNYMRSYTLSRELCDRIVAYYKDNPAYPKNFWKKIDVRVEKNIVTGDFYVRSNLSDLLANIADLEERYT